MPCDVSGAVLQDWAFNETKLQRVVYSVVNLSPPYRRGRITRTTFLTFQFASEKMLTFLLALPFWVKIALLVLLVLAGLKARLVLTMGVCRSRNKLTGKTVIITGGNSGIGKETAIDLAKRGARVILACRDLKRADDARGKVCDSYVITYRNQL